MEQFTWIYMMLIKRVCFNKKLTHPYHSSGNYPTALTISYSVDYLSCIILLRMCAGGETHIIPWGFCKFWANRAIQNQNETYITKIYMRITLDFTWPAIYGVSIKTRLYGYFCGKDKNTAIWLKLLILALLQRRLSTVLWPT